MSIEDVRDRIPTHWGKWIQVNEGWYGIVSDLDERLARIDPNYTVHQVKEKFGGLRYYYDTATDRKAEMDELVAEAKMRAAETCEECGGHGRLIDDRGWTMVSCDTHAPLDSTPLV